MKKTILTIALVSLCLTCIFASQLTFTGDFEFGYKFNFKSSEMSSLHPKGNEVQLSAKVVKSYVTMTFNGTLNGSGTRNIAGNIGFKLTKALNSAYNMDIPVDIAFECGNLSAVDSLVAYYDYFGNKYAYATTAATGTDTISADIEYEGYSLRLSVSPVTSKKDFAASLKFVPKKGIGISAAYALKGGYYKGGSITDASKGVLAGSAYFDAEKVLDLPFAATVSVGGRFLLEENQADMSVALKAGYGKLNTYTEVCLNKMTSDLSCSLDFRLAYNEEGTLRPSIYFRNDDIRYYSEKIMSGGVELAYTLQTLTTTVSVDYVKGDISSTVKIGLAI
ncbi:MAG: hypothetical protein IJ863_02920 [Spirochaetales bacterium]|nr:hypothetical protein [Spirochaetales bacterium]